MGAMLAEADQAVAVHGEANPCPPSESVVVAVDLDRFDHDLPLDPGDLLEQFRDARRLQPALCGQLHVLEVAAAATSWPSVGAWRLDPVG